MPDTAPNGANQRRTSDYCTNAAAARTTAEGVPAWMPDSAGMLCCASVFSVAVKFTDQGEVEVTGDIQDRILPLLTL